MHKTLKFAALFAVAISGFAASAFAQINDPRFANLPTPVAPQATPKFTFMLCWKEDNAVTREVAQSVKTAAAKRADRSQWTDYNVNEPKAAPIVEQYKLSRAPMPLVLCVAPNGAVTGGFPQ